MLGDEFLGTEFSSESEKKKLYWVYTLHYNLAMIMSLLLTQPFLKIFDHMFLVI